MAITITTSLTAFGNYYLDKQDIENHLDSLLSQAGLSFTAIANRDIKQQNWTKLQERMDAIPAQGQHYMDSRPNTEPSYHYENKYRFQIWGPRDQLLLRSSNAPNQKLSNGRSGFNDFIIGNLRYRVFTNHDSESQLTFVVAEPYLERDQLAHHIMFDDIYIMLLTYPLSGFLIWVIIGRGLSAIGRIAHELKQRAPSHLEAVSVQSVPVEIKPLIEELDKLFARLKEAFEREKRFASDAAHELRTPLAAIRTQAQVALIVAKSPEQLVVLQNVIMGVDRASHIVNQLLTMSRLVPEAQKNTEVVDCDMNKLTREVAGQLSTLALEKNINIALELATEPALIAANQAAMVILIRNLIDNAIRYTPRDGQVDVAVAVSNNYVDLIVSDTGPGIPAEFRKRVFERFFRMLGNESPGSGLGLSIVKQIVDLHQAEINLSARNADDTGLVISVRFRRKEE